MIDDKRMHLPALMPAPARPASHGRKSLPELPLRADRGVQPQTGACVKLVRTVEVRRASLTATPRAALAVALLAACSTAAAQGLRLPDLDEPWRPACCSLAQAADDTRAPAAAATDVVSDADRRFRTRALVGGYAAGVALYGYFSWWGKDVQRHVVNDDGTVTVETLPNRTSKFRFSDEGWFGTDSVAGGADKLGHAFAFYTSTRLLTTALSDWAGQPRGDAIGLAAATSAAVSLAIEVFDGYTLEYGFSWQDMAMNLLGVGAGVLLETYPRADQLIDLRFQYWPSDDAKKYGETNPFNDYSGQTYLLVFKASGVPELQRNRWLRYLELQFGYGSRGYSPHPGPYAPEQPVKERNLYFGVGLNLTELLRGTVFKEPSTARRVTEGFLEYLQVPGTNLLYEYNLDD